MTTLNTSVIFCLIMSVPETDPIKDIIEGDFSQRIHAISSDVCSFNAALQKAEAWRSTGNFVIYKAGTYDILTLNHILGLVQFRTLGAMALLGIESAETDREQLLVHEVAASDNIKLMVTLDTNRGMAGDKSYRPEKGGSPKPTLDWYSRAMMLAAQSIPLPGYEGRRSAVDYITRHGPDCCDACEGNACTNENNELMAVGLKPDLVVITESQQALGKLEEYKEQGLLPNTQISVVIEDENQYLDPVLGGPIKTTAIVNRMRS